MSPCIPNRTFLACDWWNGSPVARQAIHIWGAAAPRQPARHSAAVPAPSRRQRPDRQQRQQREQAQDQRVAARVQAVEREDVPPRRGVRGVDGEVVLDGQAERRAVEDLHHDLDEHEERRDEPRGARPRAR
jgi:hypothetical protein